MVHLDVLFAELCLGKSLLAERLGERDAGGDDVSGDDRIAFLHVRKSRASEPRPDRRHQSPAARPMRTCIARPDRRSGRPEAGHRHFPSAAGRWRHNSLGERSSSASSSASALARRPICAALAGCLRSFLKRRGLAELGKQALRIANWGEPLDGDDVANVSAGVSGSALGLFWGHSGVAVGGCGASGALRSGQATPRSGSGASGALGSRSAGSGAVRGRRRRGLRGRLGWPPGDGRRRA